MLEWKISEGFIDYQEAVAAMEERVAAIAAEKAPEMVWLLEHPPLYTAGTSAKQEDLLLHNLFPVYKSGRGGQYTYHGPGQRIAYIMLNLKKRSATDIRAYVQALQRWIIATLAEFGIEGLIRPERIGIWVKQEGRPEAKIAAIGIRVRKWISYHGISINLCPDLSHYNAIIPCGIKELGVTSLHELGKKITMNELDEALKNQAIKNHIIFK